MAKKKLKGAKRVNRIINEYLKRFNIKAELDLDFSCYMRKYKITYALMVADPADKYFIPFVKSLAPDFEADIFLISLFHEVGHAFTQFNLSTEVWFEGWRDKDDLESIINETEDEDIIREQNMRYFNLPEEKAATEWAINYMRTHADDVADFWAELQPAIMRFFRKNKLV